ncbi:SpoIIE family protein phosphatase [Nostocales cyanobacterium LEGE 11386]|nr:SpoIIE family protein phosphatase [Nostocales cyanobacterium LEGE 11386]
MFKILIIDDDPIVRAALKRTLQNQGYDTTVASNGEEGITQAKILYPALIICDWVMSEIDGLEVCRQVKGDPNLATTFFILLTAKGAAPGEEGERVQGLDAGADEFVSKPIEMNELKARVRAGLRLHQLNQDLKNKQLALEKSNQNLEAELAEAADYVRSLLPPPLVGAVTTEALFVPSAQLGGDCFDYYWIDSDNLAIYLLDVSGHGVGSALLSMSVLNVLRSQSLPNTNFCYPGEVLKALNHTFQMSSHGNKYFTIWYGVYNRLTHQLIYANAGHPPAVLLAEDATNIKQLDSLDLPIGFVPDIDFAVDTLAITENSTLYLFSDGAYEVLQSDGKMWGFNAFFDLLIQCTQANTCNLQQILAQIKNLSASNAFDDDLSLLKVTFS